MSLLSTLGGGLLQGAVLLAICISIEQIAVIECYSLKSRIPGALMQATGAILGVFLIWPLGRLWDDVAPWIVIPLWDWLEPLGLGGLVLQFIILLAVADFLAYWRHRLEHSRWWWPVHKVHHAPRELHAANDIGHPLQGLFTFLIITVPMSLFHIDGPATPLALGLVVAFLSMYIHSPIDFHFGPLRRVIVDNRFHRIHHSLEERHLDKNFGICFSVWDQMFGTAYLPARDEWPEVGVAGLAPPETVMDYLKMPFRNIKAPQTRWSPHPTTSAPQTSTD